MCNHALKDFVPCDYVCEENPYEEQQTMEAFCDFFFFKHSYAHDLWKEMRHLGLLTTLDFEKHKVKSRQAGVFLCPSLCHKTSGQTSRSSPENVTRHPWFYFFPSTWGTSCLVCLRKYLTFHQVGGKKEEGTCISFSFYSWTPPKKQSVFQDYGFQNGSFQSILHWVKKKWEIRANAESYNIFLWFNLPCAIYNTPAFY